MVGSGTAGYFVRPPNAEFDVRVPEEQVRVRWDRPIADPVEVLAAGAQESAFFRDARLPMLRSLVAQRAACAGVPSLLSAAVEIYPHQVHTALTVLSDPVQRYLLADEVGLGKTIEAGLIIRQTLLDQPDGRVVIIAPMCCAGNGSPNFERSSLSMISRARRSGSAPRKHHSDGLITEIRIWWSSMKRTGSSGSVVPLSRRIANLRHSLTRPRDFCCYPPRR